MPDLVNGAPAYITFAQAATVRAVPATPLKKLFDGSATRTIRLADDPSGAVGVFPGKAVTLLFSYIQQDCGAAKALAVDTPEAQWYSGNHINQPLFCAAVRCTVIVDLNLAR